MNAALIAPCGMNCRLCLGYQREKNHCGGCRGDNASMPASCLKCIIRNCPVIQSNASGMCYECESFPCRRLKQLDKRYRTKYQMSMLENLEGIRLHGMEAFLLREESRWTCAKCGGIVCVHRTACPTCNDERITT